LEVLNAKGHWMPAPYVPGTIVVNIGDLIAQVSGREFVATKHRVRTNSSGSSGADGMGRFSVSFFFEPGEACVVQSIERDKSIVYGEYVRKKKGTWVEYQDDDYGESTSKQTGDGVPVEAY
jgi:isopenicillin N synthase-like dioxygenase